MKRILMVLVLLVTVTLVAGSTAVPVALADEGAISVPETDVKHDDLEAALSGSQGDPDGMGTGNGFTGDDDDPFFHLNGGELDGLDAEEALLYLLSLIELLAL